MRWTIFIRPDAQTALRRIPRGEVAYITEAISALQANPFRPDAEILAEHTYRIIIRGRTIEYSVASEEVKILFIK